MRKFKEDDLQKAVAKYLDFMKITWCHVANERKASFAAGKRLKDKGVKSGVPDCLIFSVNKKFNGLAIELKVKPNKPTKNQLYWLDQLSRNNWRTEVCYDFDEAKKIIDEYLIN